MHSIKVLARADGVLEEDSVLLRGIVLDKSLAVGHMAKVYDNAVIAVVSFALDVPQLKTQHTIDVGSVEQLEELQEVQKQYYEQFVERFAACGVSVVMCQWSCHPVAADLLQKKGIGVIPYVAGA